MNLSPAWVDVLAEKNIESIHWSGIGTGNAADKEMFLCVRKNYCVFFTHDLHFGDIPAASALKVPVLFNCGRKTLLLKALHAIFEDAVKRFSTQLEQRVLITIVLVN